MLKVSIIAIGLLLASAGEASAPPSPRGGRKPAETPAATTPAASAQPAAPAAAEPAPATDSAPPVAAPAKAPPRKAKPTRARERDTAIAERSAPMVDAAPTNGPIPPSLSSTALRQEVTQTKGSVLAGGGEREKLEALTADLARARAALQAETARLEALLKSKPAGTAPGAEAPGTAPMPVGDPMQPQRPAPAPNTAAQVEIVSRALKGMKPEQAAAIIGHLNRSLAADVLQRMRPADAGLILGFLKPELGASLATEIANREPAPKGKSGDKERP